MNYGTVLKDETKRSVNENASKDETVGDGIKVLVQM